MATRFFVPESDHLTLMNVYQNWKKHDMSPAWAADHYVHHKSLKKV